MAEITVAGAGGEYMESVTVVEWHKNVGDPVQKGEIIVTVETAKAATEIEAIAGGLLTQIQAPVGQEVSVGAVLGTIEDNFDARAFFEKVDTGFSKKNTLKQEFRAVDCVNQNKNRSRAQTANNKDPNNKEILSQIEPRAVSSEHASRISDRIIASPLARRVARERSINLKQVRASSPSGRIKLRDLVAFSSLSKTPSQAADRFVAIKHIKAENAPKIVFLHGFGSDGSSWYPLLAALDVNFDIYLIDLPGHGRSDLPLDPINSAAMIQDIIASLKAAALEDFHLVGHSLGGALALELVASNEFFIRSLTLLAPAGLGAEINGDFITGFCQANHESSLGTWLRELVFDPSLITQAFVKSANQARQNAQLRHIQSQIAAYFFPNGTQIINWRQILQKLTIPQKIIWGEQDKIIPSRHALQLGGRVGVHFLSHIGHMPHWEDPALVARLLKHNIKAALAG